jgi:hypothetical protein
VSGKILIASDQKVEAESLLPQVVLDYPNVSASYDPEHYVTDFERIKPDVLLLVFKSIEVPRTTIWACTVSDYRTTAQSSNDCLLRKGAGKKGL